MKIYKYKVPFLDHGYFPLDLPKGAKILTAQMQGEEPQIWALVNPDNPAESRKFLSAGTGQQLKEKEEDLHYIGTYQEDGGMYIWHLFEVKRG